MPRCRTVSQRVGKEQAGRQGSWVESEASLGGAGQAGYGTPPGWRVSGAPSRAAAPEVVTTDPLRTPAFHDLLQFHLQGLDCSGWVITSQTLDPVDGEFPISHCSDVIILEENDPIGVFYDSTGVRKTGVTDGACPRPLLDDSPSAPQVWVCISSPGGHFRKDRDTTHEHLFTPSCCP